eukprot:CAMPEP_0115173048 /NCGR_PEP_ID=MMETSP0270-20121206/3128_1 /TAXON_ID=71861 /ORGANISM="Scrippsiella trochoidea, Strain CCMP3099" /LENGTH=118 /DNA_ID=CAMNT_0002585855 /DNA_START=706 /DNA_END=1062 /DNA_ORIENTATION=-
MTKQVSQLRAAIPLRMVSARKTLRIQARLVSPKSEQPNRIAAAPLLRHPFTREVQKRTWHRHPLGGDLLPCWAKQRTVKASNSWRHVLCPGHGLKSSYPIGSHVVGVYPLLQQHRQHF